LLAWIAHGILDSIVDSFFPILSHIEVEAAFSVFTEQDGSDGPMPTPRPSPPPSLPPGTLLRHSKEEKEKSASPDSKTPVNSMEMEKPPFSFALDEKLSNSKDTASIKTKSTLRFVVPTQTPGALFRRWKRFILRQLEWPWKRTSDRSSTQQVQINPTTLKLRRMARTRRLVTTLGRVLSSKAEVVARLRKRLLTPSEKEIVSKDEVEVAIYMGDIQGSFHIPPSRSDI
jgi:magnesium transporter